MHTIRCLRQIPLHMHATIIGCSLEQWIKEKSIPYRIGLCQTWVWIQLSRMFLVSAKDKVFNIKIGVGYQMFDFLFVTHNFKFSGARGTHRIIHMGEENILFTSFSQVIYNCHLKIIREGVCDLWIH